MSTLLAWLTRCSRLLPGCKAWKRRWKRFAAAWLLLSSNRTGAPMTGNNPAPISEAELAQLLADHHARMIANQRRNAAAAYLRQRQRAEALGTRLD